MKYTEKTGEVENIFEDTADEIVDLKNKLEKKQETNNITADPEQQ